jgi:hypothetical protein
MSRTKKSDLIKSSYRLAAFIILISININILSAQTGASTNTYQIGKSYRGGIIFYVTPNGRHGLIAETQDQGKCSFYNAQDYISTSSNHSREGQKFTDWRLPTKNELNLLFLKKGLVGGFAEEDYWSSTEFDGHTAWYQFFKNGKQDTYGGKTNTGYLRAIRSF